MNTLREDMELRAWFRKSYLNDFSVEVLGNHGVFQRTEQEVAELNRKAERMGIKPIHTR
jgi:hypothetical protein